MSDVDKPPPSPREIFDLLGTVLDQLATLWGRVDKLSPNAALSVGFALGAISKAQSQVARDIDDNAKRDGG